MYSYGPLHMAEQKQDDQHEHTFSNYVRIQDVVQKTCQRRWTIGKSGERGSGISVLPARHDDDDDNFEYKNLSIQLHFFSKFNLSNFCACVGLHNWYLTTDYSTKTKIFFFIRCTFLALNVVKSKIWNHFFSLISPIWKKKKINLNVVLL